MTLQKQLIVSSPSLSATSLNNCIISLSLTAAQQKKRKEYSFIQYSSTELQPSASILHYSLFQTVTDLSSRCNVLFLVFMLILALCLLPPPPLNLSRTAVCVGVCACPLSSCLCVSACTSSRQHWVFLKFMGDDESAMFRAKGRFGRLAALIMEAQL